MEGEEEGLEDSFAAFALSDYELGCEGVGRMGAGWGGSCGGGGAAEEGGERGGDHVCDRGGVGVNEGCA